MGGINMEWKKNFHYNIPIQGQKQCDKYNKMLAEMSQNGDFTPIKSTETHIQILAEKLAKEIWSVARAGGMYLGDGVKVNIEIEYDPEDK
ncbi:hypothetical protein PQE68_gp057 [Bacillus phage vB_BanS_Sophrita]|uniref:Uncharacterized protein n=1 Tax=Bacillus phage vB_BanS_Sophrita TaxID=2894790 RepID=A0AAE8YTU6_9CAUD|nr:hypothetical protein PQE68_gp057 [Bacillus phage vB_BanS_Sophrita]UGO50648.1 hypothetical protein SOPHRITA_57 [Bacillus phage vB_BanS_Sophrita]